MNASILHEVVDAYSLCELVFDMLFVLYRLPELADTTVVHAVVRIRGDLKSGSEAIEVETEA